MYIFIWPQLTPDSPYKDLRRTVTMMDAEIITLYHNQTKYDQNCGNKLTRS